MGVFPGKAEEGLSDPSQRKARPWAAGGGEQKETGLPSLASWSPLQDSPVTTQAEEEVSGPACPEAWRVLVPRRSRGLIPIPSSQPQDFQGPEADGELALQYPIATQGGNSHHCGEGLEGEILLPAIH